MKCHKCSKPAVIHLTELVNGPNGQKQAMEIHFCLGHAVEAGLVASELPTEILIESSEPQDAPPEAENQAIVPVITPPTGLVVARRESENITCPICGMTWQVFRQAGQLGCAHDYELFADRLLPLIKRAQEGAQQHHGKRPARQSLGNPLERRMTETRLRQALRKAVEAEDYQQAARLRDELRQLAAAPPSLPPQ